jgi:hypothetical protein
VVSGGQSKVCKFTSHALVGDQDILRLEVPVVDSNRVAVLDGIQNLKKGSLDKIIVANKLALLSDVGEQVTFWAVLDYNVGAIRGVHYLDQRDYIWMSASLMMELDLALLEFPLARLQANLVERLHGIWNVGLYVHCCVNDSICPYTKDTGKLKPSSKHLA